MVDALEEAGDDGDKREEAETAIQEDPLSVEIRSGWTAPGTDMEPEEFMILLCTGGPAVRLIGELDQYKQADNVRVEYQDWGTPWTRLAAFLDRKESGVTLDDMKKVLIYAQKFYFGE